MSTDGFASPRHRWRCKSRLRRRIYSASHSGVRSRVSLRQLSSIRAGQKLDGPIYISFAFPVLRKNFLESISTADIPSEHSFIIRSINSPHKDLSSVLSLSIPRYARSCRNEMHLTYPALYALRLSINQGVGPALYKTRSFDRGAATSAVFLATIGLSLSMFSLKQMRSSHQRRLRRLC